MKMVTGRDRKNLKILLENHPDIIADIVKAHQAGDLKLETWTGHGTSGAAIKEYLETIKAKPKPKPKRKRSAKTKKDTPPSLEN